MNVKGFPDLGALLRRRRHYGFAVADDRLVGLSVAVKSGRVFAHLLSDCSNLRGWAVLLEPLRFFARRAVIPKDFAGREAEYIRYNRPDIIPVPESHSLTLRFSTLLESGETLLHGTRTDRLGEFVESRRKKFESPKIEGVIPPSIALMAALKAIRPNLAPRTLVVLIGARTTRYLAIRDGALVNVFDDVHRADASEARGRFRKTLQRVGWHMENEGLGGPPEAVLILGDPSVRDFVVDARQILPGSNPEFVDALREVGLIIPENFPADMAILAVGAALAAAKESYGELNFIGVPKAVAARRFDVYDLVTYGSLAAMLALSFVTLNAVVASRIQTLREGLESNSRRVREIREEVDSKRGILPVAERLARISGQKSGGATKLEKQVMESLPEFMVMISETMPDGVWLDRINGGNDVTEEPTQGYKGIHARAAASGQVMILGQTRQPDKAIGWLSRLSDRLSSPASMDEMKLDEATSMYRFKIVISSGVEKPNA